MRSVIDQEDSHAIVSERCSEHRILGADGPHPFDTIKARMGATHFLMKWLPKRRRRDGVARPRLQSHACDEHDWHAEPDLGERHLRHVLLSYMDYYNGTRTHLSLNKDAPISRAAEAAGRILSRPILGGLHHQYARA